MAAREGLQALLHIITAPVCIESDCSLLINELTRPAPSRAIFAPLLDDAHEMLRSVPDYKLLKTQGMQTC